MVSMDVTEPLESQVDQLQQWHAMTLDESNIADI